MQLTFLHILKLERQNHIIYPKCVAKLGQKTIYFPIGDGDGFGAMHQEKKTNRVQLK